MILDFWTLAVIVGHAGILCTSLEGGLLLLRGAAEMLGYTGYLRDALPILHVPWDTMKQHIAYTSGSDTDQLGLCFL